MKAGCDPRAVLRFIAGCRNFSAATGLRLQTYETENTTHHIGGGDSLAVCVHAFAQAPDAQGHDGKGRHGRHGQHGERGQFLANLSVEERAQLRAARQKAMADPALQAAKDRMRQARRELRDSRRAAMLRADPSIQPILDKIPARSEHDS